MRSIPIIASVVAVALLVPQQAAAEEDDRLLLEQGTMQAGGMLGFDVQTWLHEGEDEYTSAMLVLAPQYGYFVADHLEVLARLGFAMQLADEGWDWFEGESSFEFALGIQYFAGPGPCAYFGVQLGMELWNVIDDPYKWFAVTVPVGALIPLNRHVAVDLGARFSTLVSLEDEQFAIIEVPMGFLGLQGFF
jgi:hypothetical protein